MNEVSEEIYKDSEIEWLDSIPESWGIVRLKDIAIIGTGGKNTEDKEQDGKYPFFVRSQTVEYINSYSFDGEAILTAGDGVGVGKVFHHYIGKFETHQRVYRISGFHKVNGRFLFHFIQANLSKEVLKFNVKATVDSLRMPMFQRFPVVLPPIQEQSVIAEYIDCQTAAIDRKIDLLEQKIKLYQTLRKTLINETVCRGLNHNAPHKDTGIEWIREIPAHWEVKRLKDVVVLNAKTLPETTPGNYTFRYVDISNVGQSGLQEDTELVEFQAAPSRARRIVRKHDVIISTVRTYLKAVAYFDYEPTNVIVSTGFAVLTPAQKVSAGYLAYQVRSDFFVDDVVRFSVGVSYPAINASTIAALHFVYPPYEEQVAIAAHLDAKTQQLDSITTNLTAQITTLKELRKTLINDVVTGKINVTAPAQ
jgi:type I restriction enzyme S subunit